MSCSALPTVRDFKEALAKELPAVDNDAGKTERCRDILQRLDESPMTITTLSETLVGTVVSKFKSHATLGPMAKALIKKWKKLAKESAPAASDTAVVPTAAAPTKRHLRSDENERALGVRDPLPHRSIAIGTTCLACAKTSATSSTPS